MQIPDSRCRSEFPDWKQLRRLIQHSETNIGWFQLMCYANSYTGWKHSDLALSTPLKEHEIIPTRNTMAKGKLPWGESMYSLIFHEKLAKILHLTDLNNSFPELVIPINHKLWIKNGARWFQCLLLNKTKDFLGSFNSPFPHVLGNHNAIQYQPTQEFMP